MLKQRNVIIVEKVIVLENSLKLRRPVGKPVGIPSVQRTAHIQEDTLLVFLCAEYST